MRDVVRTAVGLAGVQLRAVSTSTRLYSWAYAVILVAVMGCDSATGNLDDGSPDAIDSEDVPHQRVTTGVSALVEAINRGDLLKVRALLEAGADPNEPVGRRSAMGSAIVYFKNQKLSCNTDMLRILLEHGANPNRIDPIFKTLPLHDALALGDLVCVELLRTHGARPDSDPADTQSSMTHATKGAILTGNLKVLELPISWGVDPNVRGNGGQGWTALYEAIFAPNLAVLEALLALGVDPCVRDSGGTTAIDYARALHRPAEIVEALEKAKICASGSK